jgi:hypothetical protein
MAAFDSLCLRILIHLKDSFGDLVLIGRFRGISPVIREDFVK